jgi:hypothetical protein
VRRHWSIIVIAVAFGCGERAKLRIELPERMDGELTLFVGHSDELESGALVFDLRDPNPPELAVEVEEGGDIELGFIRQSLETLARAPGRVVLEKDATGATYSGARYFTTPVVRDASVAADEWTPSAVLPEVLARVPPPPNPIVCRRVALSTSVDTGVVGFASLAVNSPATVLVVSEESGIVEVTAERARPATELAQAPSHFVWADDGVAWTIDDQARVAAIETSTAGYVWRLVDTATLAIGQATHLVVGRDSDDRLQIAAMTESSEVLITREGDAAWLRWPFVGDADSSTVDFDLMWVGSGALLVATGLNNPVRLERVGDAIIETPLGVEGPDVLDFLRSFSFARSSIGLHMLSSGAILTRPMKMQGELFLPDRPAFRLAATSVAIDAFDDGSLLYATRGFLVGIDASDGCVEPENFETGALRYPTIIDEDHGVILDHGFGDATSSVMFLDFFEGPPRG